MGEDAEYYASHDDFGLTRRDKKRRQTMKTKGTKTQWRMRTAIGRIPGGGLVGISIPDAESITLDSAAAVLEEMNEVHRRFYNVATTKAQALVALKRDLGAMGRLLRFAFQQGRSENDYTMEAKP